MTIQQKPDLFGSDCCTSTVIETISQCLMNRPDCCHLFQFGTIYFCHHPRHIELRVPLYRTKVRSRP